MTTKSGPWRITFDTNPDDCNLRCIMCECFSPHSSVRKERVDAHIPKRRMSIDLIRQILDKRSWIGHLSRAHVDKRHWHAWKLRNVARYAT